jgi:saccharopine dehydrogenase-like NADP-dependent oxidoreductase
LRRPGFCDAWDCLVQLGLTDDEKILEGLNGMTYRDFVNAFLWYDPEMSVELKVRAYLKLDLNAPEFDKLAWLGLFEPIPIGMRRVTAARVLQQRLEEKWALGTDDRDMIVMLHKIEYDLGGESWLGQSSMVTQGSDTDRTAMAKTVGLTTAIGARLILEGTIRQRGVLIPTTPHVYGPILSELRQHGIAFEERIEQVS